MIDDTTGGDPSPLAIGSLADLRAVGTRREFLRTVALAGAVASLPPIATACGSDSATGPSNGVAGSGAPLLIDFAQGDVAILQFALVIEQVQAEFYSRVVSSFDTSNFGAAEQTLLTAMRDHELEHRAYLQGTLGANGAFTVTPTFRGVSVSDRASVLAAAKSLEDLGVAAYNGVAQYFASADGLLAIAKIVSVEARHASTVRDLLEPRTGAFAPNAADDVFRPTNVATAIQNQLVDKLGFANVPAAFEQGPNANG